jgi:DegV family protein with EDD domain
MIGVCTDSNAQLPRSLVERYGIEVVPLTVSIDGHEYLEGIDLDADAFYARFSRGETPEISTSQPSPGQFALAYEDLVASGAREIVSIHIGSGLSGTLNAARLAAYNSSVPVRLVDSGTASFGVGCCVWAAAAAIARGASLDTASRIAERLAPRIGNVFVVGALDLIRAGGRAGEAADTSLDDGVPVLTLMDGEVKVLARAATVDEAVEEMAQHALAWGTDLNVAIGIADTMGKPLSEALEARMKHHPNVREVVHYRVGPSVGAHTGPGTAGAFFYPADAATA